MDEVKAPLLTSKEWSGYVLEQFAIDELVDGCPTVDGLRRVAELLIGPIIESISETTSWPNSDNNYSSAAKHRVVFVVNPYLVESVALNKQADIATTDTLNEGRQVYNSCMAFQDVADCSPENTPNERFRKFAVAIAGTRAEARALRKALRLRKVVSIEELAEKEDIKKDSDSSDKVKPSQLNFIDAIAVKNNINVAALFAKFTSEPIKNAPSSVAHSVIKFLSEEIINKDNKPEELKGYKNWR